MELQNFKCPTNDRTDARSCRVIQVANHEIQVANHTGLGLDVYRSCTELAMDLGRIVTVLGSPRLFHRSNLLYRTHFTERESHSVLDYFDNLGGVRHWDDFHRFLNPRIFKC